LAGAPDPHSAAAQQTWGWQKNETAISNHCISPNLSREQIWYPMSSWCDNSSGAALNNTAMWSANNSYYCDGCDSSNASAPKALTYRCGAQSYNLSAWHALWASVGVGGGGELGSRALPTPPLATILTMARARVL
jgi:hypothetical protein